ncbi:MAG: hypothetical protein M0R80_16205 [Proteobacteria bacterium]|jgi:hypothetical protein|nr:hypothetical protein [Pseudomonadota bacterium]
MRPTSDIGAGRERARRDPRAIGAKAALVAFVVALPFALFHFIAPFVGTKTIGNDYTQFPLPQQMELQYSIAHGTWPLYAPGFGGGRPAAALTLGQLWHPISHVAAHLPGYWDGHAVDWNTALRLLGLGLAQLALIGVLRRLGLRLPMAFLVAFVTVYNMRSLDAFRFGASLENYTGMLLVCAAAAHLFLAEGRRWPLAAMIGATYLLAVGGHPQMMYFGFLGAGIFVAAAPFVLPAVAGEPPGPLRRALRFYAAAGACLLAGCALAAAYLVPLYADFVSEAAVRAARGYSWSLLNSDSVGGALNSFFSPLDVSVTGAFGGSSLLIVALLAPLRARAAGRAGIAAVALFAVGALAIAVSLGAATPLHGLAWAHLPFYDAFRVPGRVNFIVPVVVMPLLAWALGRCGDARVELCGRALPLTWSGLFALLGLAAFAAYWAGLGDLLPSPTRPLPAEIGSIPPAVPKILAALGAGTLAIAAVRGILPRASGALGIALALAVVTETGVVLRFGTWIAPRRDTPTMERMDGDKQRGLAFRGHPGNGMQSDIVAQRMERSFLDPHLAVFYGKHVAVADLKSALRAMAKTRAPDEIVVEGFEEGDVRAVGGGAGDAISLKRATFNDVAFIVDNESTGFLSFTELDRKGRWRAEVDGKPARVFAANGGEQAVRLEPGRHEVSYSFDSPSTRLGVAVSLAALAVVAILFSWWKMRPALRYPCMIGAVAGAAALFLLFCGALHAGDDLGTRYAWRADDRPDPGNLAFGRRTAMSSLLEKQRPYFCYAGRGVDGDRRARGFATARDKAGAWWQVDLGVRRAIGRIDVHRGSATRRGGRPPFEVMLSDDAKIFRRVDAGGARAEGNGWRVELRDEKARYVRLAAGGRGSFTLAEVEVFAP